MRDWIEWHAAYEDPGSSLSKRRDEVTRCVAQALDDAPAGPILLLSLCAGEGVDVIDAARDHPRAGDLYGCLVELHPGLVSRAQAAMTAAGLRQLEVRCGDAGDPEVWIDRFPVDVLLLVGIFGNVTETDIRRTVMASPMLCRDGATVIWTRGRWEPDLTPRIREWFDEAGCESLAFISPGPGKWSVGVERVQHRRSARDLPSRLFTFVDDLPAR